MLMPENYEIRDDGTLVIIITVIVSLCSLYLSLLAIIISIEC